MPAVFLLCYFIRYQFRYSLSFPHFLIILTRGHKGTVKTVLEMDHI